jgi:uncharacterized membrane protein
MKKNQKTRRLVLTAFFVAAQLVLMLTPIGYIPIGPVRATTMHIPVILGGMLLGSGTGAFLGFVFGLTSLLINTFAPTVTSFVFSPFITVGGIHGNFASLLIVFVPRILLGWLSPVIYHQLCAWTKKSYVSAMLSAAVNTLLHTALVMGGIAVFFAEPYAQARQILVSDLAGVIMGVVATNGVMEMILAAVIVPALMKALKPSMERMNLYDSH